MPRKGPAPRRELLPDPIYRSVLVTQLVNKILSRGKRSLAERIVYDALDTIKERTSSEPISTLKRAVDNTKPQLEVKSRRVGGATYQVPVDVKPRRATTLSVRWLVGYSRQRREKTMSERLANELLDASNGLGAAVKRREDMHKMADSNRAFAHYRW
ncbi:MAG TPA: 30S ribosomal protein S7 [Acidimicrobiales bacterium]|nr:30S ribosomal protein S7 [Acidimicrobiales bacterium]